MLSQIRQSGVIIIQDGKGGAPNGCDGCLECPKAENTQIQSVCVWEGVRKKNSLRAHCVHINAALRKSHQPGGDRGQLRLPGPWLNRALTISPITSPRVRIASSICRVLAIRATLSNLWSVRVGGGPEYMNFDQGAQNARGCGDVTQQWFLLLLCSFSPHPPAVWVGIMEKEAWEGSLSWDSNHQL